MNPSNILNTINNSLDINTTINKTGEFLQNIPYQNWFSKAWNGAWQISGNLIKQTGANVGTLFQKILTIVFLIAVLLLFLHFAKKPIKIILIILVVLLIILIFLSIFIN